jgi:hypothetical protein
VLYAIPSCQPCRAPSMTPTYTTYELSPYPTSCRARSNGCDLLSLPRPMLRIARPASSSPSTASAVANPLPGCSLRWDAPRGRLAPVLLRSNLSTQCVIDCASSNSMISLNNPTIPTFPYCERSYANCLAPFFPANDLNELATVLLLARRLQ